MSLPLANDCDDRLPRARLAIGEAAVFARPALRENPLGHFSQYLKELPLLFVIPAKAGIQERQGLSGSPLFMPGAGSGPRLSRGRRQLFLKP